MPEANLPSAMKHIACKYNFLMLASLQNGAKVRVRKHEQAKKQKHFESLSVSKEGERKTSWFVP